MAVVLSECGRCGTRAIVENAEAAARRVEMGEVVLCELCARMPATVVNLACLQEWFGSDEIEVVLANVIAEGDAAFRECEVGLAQERYRQVACRIGVRVAPERRVVYAAATYGLALVMAAWNLPCWATVYGRMAREELEGPRTNRMIREWWEGYGLRPRALIYEVEALLERTGEAKR